MTPLALCSQTVVTIPRNSGLGSQVRWGYRAHSYANEAREGGRWSCNDRWTKSYDIAVTLLDISHNAHNWFTLELGTSIECLWSNNGRQIIQDRSVCLCSGQSGCKDCECSGQSGSPVDRSLLQQWDVIIIGDFNVQNMGGLQKAGWQLQIEHVSMEHWPRGFLEHIQTENTPCQLESAEPTNIVSLFCKT